MVSAARKSSKSIAMCLPPRTRILIVVPSLRDVASVRYPVALAEILKARGVDVEIFYFDAVVEIETTVPARQVGFFEKQDLSRFDLIHTHGFRPDLYGAWHGRKARLLSTVHSDIHAELSSSYSWVVASVASFFWLGILRRFDLVVVMTGVARRFYAAVLPPSRLLTLHSGLPPARFMPADQSLAEQIASERKKGLKIVGTAARLVSIKGLDQVLTLLTLRKDLCFVLIGAGKEEQSLRSVARRLGVDQRVIFAGQMSAAERNFPLFDVCVVPSRSEGFCFTLLEAIRSGVPVVCSSIDVFVELYTPDEVCFFSLDDPGSLSTAIDRALEIGADLVRRARAKYLSEYTLEAMADRYEAAYMKLLGDT